MRTIFQILVSPNLISRSHSTALSIIETKWFTNTALSKPYDKVVFLINIPFESDSIWLK